MAISLEKWRQVFDKTLKGIKGQVNDPSEAFRVIPFIQDSRIQTFVAHWPSLHVSIIPGKLDVPKKSNSLSDRWNWIWDHVSIPYSSEIGMTETLFNQTLQKVKSAYMVFPDGTVNRFVQTYLSNVVIQAIPKTGVSKQQDRKGKNK